MNDPRGTLPQRWVWGVGALLQAVADALTARFGGCVVRGEISGFSRAGSGHCYFTLKDAEHADGSLRCALFRRSASLLDFVPADGQLVDVRGRLGVYGPRGELQLVAESMQRAGAGALYERFVRMRAQLEAEGLFDAALKRPLPRFPRRVGVVTSLDAAALHDVLTAFERRAPHLEVVVYPCRVQGADAPASIGAALVQAGRRAEVDLLILCRGGGSLEDLWAFNDEHVARTVRASPLPVVCGVGHETDVTLAELAADLRAPTPTAAAELAAPSGRACLEALDARATALRRRVSERLLVQAQRLDRAAFRLARPSDEARRQGQRLEALAHRLRTAAQRVSVARRDRNERMAARLLQAQRRTLARQQQRIDARGARLRALDPHRVLARGYALMTDSAGRPVTSIAQARVGEALQAVLGDGRLGVAVTDVIEAAKSADTTAPLETAAAVDATRAARAD